MTSLFYPDIAMKAQQWEITKGHLRALVAVQGCYGSSGIPGNPDGQTERWMELEKRVEQFIKSVEDDALQE